MEFMEGGTLTEACKNFAFKEPQIAYVAKNILEGLCYLHDRNLVHRDLKSANIMLTIKGQVKLSAFSILFPPPPLLEIDFLITFLLTD